MVEAKCLKQTMMSEKEKKVDAIPGKG